MSHACCCLWSLRCARRPTQEASALEQNVKGKAVSAEAKRAQAVASIRREEAVLSQQASELAGQVGTRPVCIFASCGWQSAWHATNAGRHARRADCAPVFQC